MLCAIMTNWFANYHHMLLLRLLSLALVFGVVGPGLWPLIAIGFQSARRLSGRLWRGRRSWLDFSL
jgi:hypothetical protein